MAGKKANPLIQDAAADEAAKAEQLAARTYLMDSESWDKLSTPEFGGQSDIMLIEIGEIVGPFTYIGHQPMVTDLGDTTVHTCSNKAGETLRAPLSATFLRSVDQAGLKRNDTFIIKRYDDVIKKKGRGAGNPMPVYAVKVLNRAPVVGA